MSSHNTLDISALLDALAPQHVITHLYQRAELSGNGARYAIAHAKTARDRGCTQGGYGWLFAEVAADRQVGDFLDTAAKAGIALGPTNPLWLDLEDYTDGSYPGLAVIDAAVAESHRLGIACGIYTGGWWWKPRTSNSQAFAALPLWDAHYGISPSLDAPGYGGWEARAGHQHTSKPVDRSVFNSAYATP